MSLIEKDLKYVWHPYTQMKDAVPPIPIVKGEGAYLIDEQGNRYLDAISSWWVNIHGHSHPYIAKKVAEQFNQLEHVIFAGFTHPKAVELAERLLQHLPSNQSKVFYSDNGSTAVEVAIKMALQYWHNQNITKTKIIALEGAYHGDTFGAMSVSGRSVFTDPFTPFLFDVVHVPFPASGTEEYVLDQLTAALTQKDVAAFIFEPLVQGASGMKMYSTDMLNRMMTICNESDVLTIADEVMTGFWRTGKFFATDHVQSNADIYCLSKGLTGGTMAMGVTSCSNRIFDAFLSDDQTKTFFHGHSFTANPVTCAAACASLDLLEKEECTASVTQIEKLHSEFIKQLKGYDVVTQVRQTGTIMAFNLVTDQCTSYFNEIRDRIYQHFIKKGLILRPLGNVLYVIPPYCVTENDLNFIYAEILTFLDDYSSSSSSSLPSGSSET